MNQKTPASRRASLTGRVLGATFVLMVASAFSAPAVAVELVPEAAARMRVDERWQSLVDGKFEEAYQYLAPGYRAVQSFKTYTSRLANTAWTGGKAVRVECNDERDKCVATVRIESKAFMPGLSTGSLTTFVEEHWIKQDGKWWLFPQS